MKNLVPSISAMAFYHEDGLVPAWKQANQFAGKNGRIATMLDIVDARIVAGINDYPWNTYYTTTSAEYFGYSRGGIRILIVAHGVGPMSTLDGIQKAYSYQYKDKTRSKQGGRISVKEFQGLESGKYGDVHIIEFDPIMERYQYPFLSFLTVDEAIAEPLLNARLGARAEEYLNHHARMANAIHEDEHGKSLLDPYIIQMGAASNCSYEVGGWKGSPREYPYLEESPGAIAHLISTGRLCNAIHEKERRVPHSIANDVGCHEWSDGVRLVAVRENAVITEIHPGVSNVRELILKNWTSLMEKIPGPAFPGGFYALMKSEDDTWFTQYIKKGARLDTYEPEHRVISLEKVGEPKEFITAVGGHHVFFKYDIKEVYSIKPPEANAYALAGEPKVLWCDGNPTHQRVNIQFYRAKVDTTQRLIKSDTLRNNYEKLMSLLVKEKTA